MRDPACRVPRKHSDNTRDPACVRAPSVASSLWHNVWGDADISSNPYLARSSTPTLTSSSTSTLPSPTSTTSPLAAPIRSYSTPTGLPPHVRQDILLLLDRFVAKQRCGQPWLPLRRQPKTTADLPALKGARGPALSQAFAQRSLVPPLEQPTPPFVRNYKPIGDLKNEESFEAVLRLHYLHASTNELSAMLACVQPAYEEAKEKQRLLRDLGIHPEELPARPLCPTGAKSLAWRSVWAPTRNPIGHGQRQGYNGCPMPTLLQPAGKPATWRAAS